jgi:hypothetical protein
MKSEVLRRALAKGVGHGSDASVIADSALGLWSKIASRLEPVVGAGGVDVLFGRAVSLTQAEFPQLAEPGIDGNSASSLASLHEAIAGCEVALATRISQQLLAAFVEILENLIGEPLTASLLGPVWMPDATPERETEP